MTYPHDTKRQRGEPPTWDPPNPSGLCMCGCGQSAPLATTSRIETGDRRGFPRRYVKGHEPKQTKLGRFVCERCGVRFKGSSSNANRYCSRECARPVPEIIPHPDIVDACLVPLSRGLFAVIDREDAERVGRMRWTASSGHSTTYAIHSNSGVLLHRYILGESDPKILVDHEDRDGLNCRRENIRRATPSGNIANSIARGGASSYKGVFRVKAKSESWGARITVNYQGIHIGCFPTEEEAARAYDTAAREHFGEFARLNFPD